MLNGNPSRGQNLSQAGAVAACRNRAHVRCAAVATARVAGPVDRAIGRPRPGHRAHVGAVAAVRAWSRTGDTGNRPGPDAPADGLPGTTGGTVSACAMEDVARRAGVARCRRAGVGQKDRSCGRRRTGAGRLADRLVDLGLVAFWRLSSGKAWAAEPPCPDTRFYRSSTPSSSKAFCISRRAESLSFS